MRTDRYSPEYEKLELADPAAFLESLDEEQRAKLRKLYKSPSTDSS